MPQPSWNIYPFRSQNASRSKSWRSHPAFHDLRMAFRCECRNLQSGALSAGDGGTESNQVLCRVIRYQDIPCIFFPGIFVSTKVVFFTSYIWYFFTWYIPVHLWYSVYTCVSTKDSNSRFPARRNIFASIFLRSCQWQYRTYPNGATGSREIVSKLGVLHLGQKKHLSN